MTNDMKASPPLINHMLPHDQQKKTRFLTSFITSNMTIFASKDLPNEIYDEALTHTFEIISSVFLTVKKSA
jgi:hypothetical protein